MARPSPRPSAPLPPAASPRGAASAKAAPPNAAPAPGPRRRSDGQESHREILRAAAALASVKGLEGLSIATLAKHVGLSKSGLFAHFRSKEELQLETIGAAAEIFREEVVAPALRLEGVARMRALVDRFLEHVRGRTFPGGCFFAATAAELDSQPGVLRDQVAAMHRDWSALFLETLAEAQRRGELDRDADAAQVAFEVEAMLVGGHGAFLLFGDEGALDRAKRGTERVLAQHGAAAPGGRRPRRASR